ncbi:MAG: hypothetical protein GX444_06580 [Myxococcales bacterium]|nr:hypothetical protein [Myxococcales bacterium]
MRQRKLFMLIAAGALLCLTIGCSLQIAGVPLEKYRPIEVPKLFDRVMDERRADDVLVAGVQVVDVTPYDRKAWIAGFGQMRKSRGVLDPVTARIVYLDDGREAVVIVAADFVGMTASDVERLRSLVTAKHPQRIQFASTHNHQGPDTIGYWGPGLLIPVERGVDTDWFDKTLQAIALGVDEAIRRAEPVRLALGQAEMESEWSSNLWFPHNAGPIDRRLGVMRLERLDGRPLATIVNWGCHAETLLDINKKISADYPGRFYKYVEQRGGGTGVFLNGGLGGMISPRICRFDVRPQYKDLDQRIAWMDRLGDRLAELAVGAVKDKPRVTYAPIAVKSVGVEIPMRNGLLTTMARVKILPTTDRQIRDNHFFSEVNYLRIGGAHFATVPGEALPSLSLRLKDALPYAEVPFVVSLANDELGYIMMPEQWSDPVYSYERSMSCGPQTGQIIYDAFVGLLAQDR